MAARSRKIAAGLAVALVAVACVKVPYTGRMQFNLIPKGVMNNIGKTSYDEMLTSSKLVPRGADVDTLKRVGGRVSKVADQPDFDWQYALIQSQEINAWCMPGGYIGFYTGILPVLQNEAGMGFVMGHEVGHAVAHHGAERMSEQLLLVGGLAGLDVFLGGATKVSPEQRALIMAAAGGVAQLGVILPFSRAHEKEADTIGLMLMSEAGYPPAESIRVWDRMAAATGSAPPAFLSTHPSNAARQDNLQEWMPEAKKRFLRNKTGGGMLEPIWNGP
jgi:predicted Zn-dependent protease